MADSILSIGEELLSATTKHYGSSKVETDEVKHTYCLQYVRLHNSAVQGPSTAFSGRVRFASQVILHASNSLLNSVKSLSKSLSSSSVK